MTKPEASLRPVHLHSGDGRLESRPWTAAMWSQVGGPARPLWLLGRRPELEDNGRRLQLVPAVWGRNSNNSTNQ
jgi:hypothetical protein